MKTTQFAKPTPNEKLVPGEVETHAKKLGYSLIAGVDEAGRGPLAGPVTAAAVVFSAQTLEMAWCAQLNDSKKLKESVRDSCFELIKEHALAWSIISYDHAKIDTLNILQATRAAMRDAVKEVEKTLSAKQIDCVYIDGNQTIETSLHQMTVVKGDARSFHIAAASILAKVDRDQKMKAYHKKYPEYGFDRHKGYGTKVHREAIAEHGPCAIHRLTFGGVKEHVQ